MGRKRHWTYAWLLSGPWWFIDLFLSGVVGAVIGYFIGDAVARRALDSKFATVFVNEDGIAQPLELLTNLATEEEKELKISFEPPALQQSQICEYSRVTGKSHTEVWLTYLSKYSMCFSVTDRDEKDWIVRAKKGSLEIEEREGAWRCKCPASSQQ